MGRDYDITFLVGTGRRVWKYSHDEKLALKCEQFNRLTVLLSRGLPWWSSA